MSGSPEFERPGVIVTTLKYGPPNQHRRFVSGVFLPLGSGFLGHLLIQAIAPVPLYGVARKLSDGHFLSAGVFDRSSFRGSHVGQGNQNPKMSGGRERPTPLTSQQKRTPCHDYEVFLMFSCYFDSVV